MLPIHSDEFCQSEKYFSLLLVAEPVWKWMMAFRAGAADAGMPGMSGIGDVSICKETPDQDY